ncbi:Uncharacterized protein dnm_038520 [Desulfonema magnum]|uniref:Uncharacterized protein n=1 Tax=Desulfonema magnum TaxID=45655 RepID=A0A975BLT1_9BACT|nr:Uncharacterized protein dnm_038520 [Desulfonema magnum]
MCFVCPFKKDLRLAEMTISRSESFFPYAPGDWQIAASGYLSATFPLSIKIST